jgi:hypothetical protein
MIGTSDNSRGGSLPRRHQRLSPSSRALALYSTNLKKADIEIVGINLETDWEVADAATDEVEEDLVGAAIEGETSQVSEKKDKGKGRAPTPVDDGDVEMTVPESQGSLGKGKGPEVVAADDDDADTVVGEEPIDVDAASLARMASDAAKKAGAEKLLGAGLLKTTFR